MKPKTKRLFKIISVMLIVLIVFPIITPIYASEGTESEPSAENGFGFDNLLDGIAGVLLYVVRLIPIAIGAAIQGVGTLVADVGNPDWGGMGILTLDKIFFGYKGKTIPIIDINFFTKLPSAGSDNIIMVIRNNVATWYYALRNVAIILSLVVLIYIGIRMAISTIAEDKAKYKKMITDWVVGFITIFVIHYLIIITINVNQQLVQMINPANNGSSAISEKFFDKATKSVYFTEGLTNAVLYAMIVILTMMFLINYIKRMLTVAFLVIISPLITLTYSIDRMGDRKISSSRYMDERIYV